MPTKTLPEDQLAKRLPNMEIPPRSGIYGIFGPSGKVYIGSAINCESRIKRHVRLLNLNSHHCNWLQNSWNKHGEESFHIVALENCIGLSGKELIPREQAWMEKYRGNLYNSAPIAGSVAGVKWNQKAKAKMIGNKNAFGAERSDETRRRLGLANRGKKRTAEQIAKNRAAQLGKKLSEEHKRKLSISGLGTKRPPRTEEYKRKISAANLGRKHGPCSEEKAKRISESKKGKPNGLKGKKQSIEAKRNKSIARIGMKFTDEHKRKLSEAKTGKKMNIPEADRLRRSEQAKAMIACNRAKRAVFASAGITSLLF